VLRVNLMERSKGK